MKISAWVENARGEHRATIETNGQEKQLPIAAKAEGCGSAVNGGELLFLALATCYCNDIYREAAKRGLSVNRVSVDVNGEFGGPGEPARNIEYRIPNIELSTTGSSRLRTAAVPAKHFASQRQRNAGMLAPR